MKRNLFFLIAAIVTAVFLPAFDSTARLAPYATAAVPLNSAVQRTGAAEPGSWLPARKGSEVRWLAEPDAQKIPWLQLRTKAKRPRDLAKSAPIASRERAYEYLMSQVSMAMPPRVAYEDDEWYYFSGGTRAYRVDDFSTGMMVSKAMGEIRSWE